MVLETLRRLAGMSVTASEGCKHEKLEEMYDEKTLSEMIVKMKDAHEIITKWGYPHEEHTLTTPDSSHITLHRIPSPRFGRPRHTEPLFPSPLPPLLVWHGLGISSDVWISNLHPTSNLAFVLADAGYDVWLANSRGNHYTKACPSVVSIDEIGYMDVPVVVDYVLGCTRRERVAYLGYSQGTTAIFAALSVNGELNDKISAVYALAPSLTPRPTALADTPIKRLLDLAGPMALYSLFGSGQFLPLTNTIKKTIPSPLFARMMDFAFSHLFGWRCDQLGSIHRKKAIYHHCFGGTSVKNLVQWFQVIDHGSSLLHYNPNAMHWLTDVGNAFNKTRHTPMSPIKYPTKHITTKLHLFCGTADKCISDVEHLLEHLPKGTEVYEIEGYGHLDFCWAVDVKEKVWDTVIELMRKEEMEGASRGEKAVKFAPGTKMGSPSRSERGWEEEEEEEEEVEEMIMSVEEKLELMDTVEMENELKERPELKASDSGFEDEIVVGGHQCDGMFSCREQNHDKERNVEDGDEEEEEDDDDEDDDEEESEEEGLDTEWTPRGGGGMWLNGVHVPVGSRRDMVASLIGEEMMRNAALIEHENRNSSHRNSSDSSDGSSDEWESEDEERT